EFGGTPPRLPAGRRRYDREPCTLSGKSLSRIFVLTFRGSVCDQLIGVRNRGGNHICAACPLAKIDGATAVTAEGKLGVAALYDFLADRTVKFKSAFSRHSVRIPVLAKSLQRGAPRYRILATRS